MTQIYATSERTANKLGLDIFSPRPQEYNYDAGTNDPDFKYQHNGKIYFLDGVLTGESCKTPVNIIQEATHKRIKKNCIESSIAC